MESQEQLVVVPLAPMPEEPTTEVMLRMLLNREALTISRASSTPAQSSSDLLAQGGGAFAKAVGQAIGNLPRTAGVTDDMFRVVLPVGATARDLVPAVGGGFRGLVRSAGAPGIKGHATLIPIAAGATIAAGPLIATVGLAVIGEMIATRNVSKKLEAINSAVLDLKVRADDQERSILTTADQQARKVVGYLLDQAQIPAISSAAHAFGDLDTLTNMHIDRLGRWIDIADRHRHLDRVYAPDLMKHLVGKQANPVAEFERMVIQTYEALAIRARVVVLEKVAAEFSNGDRSLPHVENVLRAELATLAEHQSRLNGLLEDLTVLPTDSSKVPIAFAGKGTLSARTSFGRLSRALHNAPDSPAMLTHSEQSVLELAPSRDGLRVLEPVTA